VDSFGCYDKPKELTASYPQEEFGGIHLLLVRRMISIIAFRSAM